MSGKQRRQGPIAKTVAKNISQLLQITKTPHTHLSNRLYSAGCDIPPLAIRRILSNNRNITIDEAAALAGAFGLSLEQMLLPDAANRCRELVIAWAMKRAEEEWPQ